MSTETTTADVASVAPVVAPAAPAATTAATTAAITAATTAATATTAVVEKKKAVRKRTPASTDGTVKKKAEPKRKKQKPAEEEAGDTVASTASAGVSDPAPSVQPGFQVNRNASTEVPDSDSTTVNLRPSAAAAAQPSSADTADAFGTQESLPSNVVFCMRTLQAAQWRTIADALKDPVPECIFKCDKSGMKMISMDKGHVALIHLHATAEFYYCKEEVSLHVNVLALYRMLRNLTTAGYMLEFILTEDERDHLQIIVTNTDKKTVTTNSLKLLNIPDESIYIPTTTFNRVLSMPATDFQRYIRELSAVSRKIRIKSTKNVLILSAAGASCSTSIQIEPTARGMHWAHRETEGKDGNQNEDDEVTGVFHSKYLEKFSRPLDDVVEIFVKQEYPLVLRYVMPAAVIRLVIAPCSDNDLEDASDELENSVM